MYNVHCTYYIQNEWSHSLFLNTVQRVSFWTKFRRDKKGYKIRVIALTSNIGAFWFTSSQTNLYSYRMKNNKKQNLLILLHTDFTRFLSTGNRPGGHSTLGYAPCATKKTLLFFARSHRKTPIFTNFHPMTTYFSKILTLLTKCWEIFGHFGPESPYFLMHFTERPPIFVCIVTERPPFLTQFVTDRPVHLKCLVALVRHTFICECPPGNRQLCWLGYPR